MKLLFAYSLNLKKDKNGNLYLSKAFPNEILKRYLDLSDDLVIFAHIDEKEYDVSYANEQFEPLKYPHIRIVLLPKLRRSFKNFLSISKRREFKHKIKETVKSVDKIICRMPSPVASKTIKYAKKFDKPVFVEVVGCAFDSLWNHSLKGKIIAIPNYFMMKLRIKTAPHVLYVSEKFLQKRYPSQGKTINCSNVMLQSLDEEVLKRKTEDLEKMSHDSPIIIGTLAAVNVKYKGQQYVIKAISKLNKQGYNFRYHLIGGGDQTYLTKIAKKYDVEDKVKFLGTVSHDKVFSELDKLHLYIQPSAQEGLPRAVIEAMSRGLPVLGSNAGGIPELIEENYVFKKGSVRAVKKALIKVLNKEKLIKTSKRNFNEAQKYDKEILDKRRKAFYAEFADK